MLRFEEGRLIFFYDIERCPYAMHDPKSIEWMRKDDKRLMLIALERYLMILNYLKKLEIRIPSPDEKSTFRPFLDNPFKNMMR